eukprot:m.10918 g.10918  ORF g.10918 m.10918 type:complete len:726 (+) comp5632_c0_seq2:200-2377(+)
MTQPHLFPHQQAVEHSGFVTLDFQMMSATFNEPTSSQELAFAEDLQDEPALVLRAMGLAFYQAWYETLHTAIQDSDVQHLPFRLPKVDIRLSNFSPLTPLRHLKAGSIGKFVAIKGTVVRVSNIRQLVTTMCFQCNKCHTQQVAELPDGKYRIPARCVGEGCRSRTFTPNFSSPFTQTIDFQTIRIQEIIEDDQRESGRIPRSVECEVFHDLVDKCTPGDVIVISGEVRVVSSDEGRRMKQEKCMFLLYIHTNALYNSRSKIQNGGQEDETYQMEHTQRDLYAIQRIHAEENTFRSIVHSFCPMIYGQELVKAGLVLALFGGCAKYPAGDGAAPLRGDPHILVVGDPGLGKSQMLQALGNIAPRGVYVCGNTTTTAGLTVSLHKDSGGDYALEAGALVLADQGVCCIDEFDKMGMQHQALLEAMEQQCISIAKAGIVCSLPARTSIIAAANPVGGHYNKGKTVSENIKMGSALLSRFDLVFILLDEANEERDRLLSEHVMALHSTTVRTRGHALDEFSRLPMSGSSGDKDCLMDRLRLQPGESVDAIPSFLMRKYVAYARKYVHPRLTQEARVLLKEFYLQLRQQHQSAESTPITTRQLESLIRLAEARARAELREEVSARDAADVIEIMRNSLFDTYCDEFGRPDIQRSQFGSGMSKKAQTKVFVAELSRISDATYNTMFSIDQLKTVAQDMGLQVENFHEFISSLNFQGYLLKKGPSTYRLRI